jgi:hypothetical protein
MHAEKQINANERTCTLAEDQVDDLRMQSQDIRDMLDCELAQKGAAVGLGGGRTRRHRGLRPRSRVGIKANEISI